ncbi:Protein of unknown function [Propionibacterium freudenreichii]|nr:Protein of unknown function [Propionibacterium freudenreichii]
MKLPLLLEGPFIEADTAKDLLRVADIAPPSGGALH